MNTSCGVNRAGVHCRALSTPLAPEPIFWANLNKKNLQTFAGPFRLMFNLLLFDTVPPCISFPFLKPAPQCHAVGLGRGNERNWAKRKRKEEGNDVFLFMSIQPEKYCDSYTQMCQQNIIKVKAENRIRLLFKQSGTGARRCRKKHRYLTEK